jgi:ABC-type transport system involved in multi-copper enzyme maturation permease subunit
MKNIRVIAQNTLVELLRNRLLYVLLFFTVFLLCLMVALGQLSYTEQLRLTLGLGLGSIHICLVGLTIFVGGSIVYREIDRLTILTLLARSITRTEFLVGKFFGFLSLMFLLIGGFFLLYVGNLLFMNFTFEILDLLLVFIGFFLEIMLLLAVTIFFSTFCASFLAIVFSLCFFIIGHWVGNLGYLAEVSGAGRFKTFAKIMRLSFPNLENFNWRSYPMEHNIEAGYMLGNSVNAVIWTAFFLFCATLIFKDRDFA